MCCSLQGSGGKTPEKQTTPSGKEDLDTSVADNDEIKGAVVQSTGGSAVTPVQSTGGSAVTPSRYCAIASLDEAAFDEEVKKYFLNLFFLSFFAQLLPRFQNNFHFSFLGTVDRAYFHHYQNRSRTVSKLCQRLPARHS